MFIKRIISAPFCATKISSKISELTKRMQTAKSALESPELNDLKKKVDAKSEQNKKKNLEVHQLRIKLTQDIQKAQKIWVQARKKIDKNKSDAIQTFAKSLVTLGDQFQKTQQCETEQHSVDLKEGFQLTSRLFLSTLQKYNIKRTELNQKDKVKKGQFEKVGEEAIQDSTLKGTIAKVQEQGWIVEGKLTVLPKVSIYI